MEEWEESEEDESEEEEQDEEKIEKKKKQKRKAVFVQKKFIIYLFIHFNVRNSERLQCFRSHYRYIF